MGPDSHHEETYPPIRPYVGYRDENAFFAVLRDNIYDLCVLPLLFLEPVTPSPLLWLENFLTPRWLVVKKGTIAVLNFIDEGPSLASMPLWNHYTQKLVHPKAVQLHYLGTIPEYNVLEKR